MPSTSGKVKSSPKPKTDNNLSFETKLSVSEFSRVSAVLSGRLQSLQSTSSQLQELFNFLVAISPKVSSGKSSIILTLTEYPAPTADQTKTANKSETSGT